MLDLDEIRGHLEALNDSPRLTTDELLEAIVRDGIGVSPDVLDLMKQALQAPPKTRPYDVRILEAIERHQQRALHHELGAAPEAGIRVFFWVVQNEDLRLGYAEIGDEIGFSASATQAAIAHLVDDEGIITRNVSHDSRLEDSYRVPDFQWGLRRIRPGPEGISPQEG